MRTPRTILLDIAKGTAIGIALAAVLLGVGLARVAVFLLGGGRLRAPASAEFRSLAVYAVSLAAVGALLGAARPLLRTKAGVYAGLMAGGAVVLSALALSDRRSAGFEGADWAVIILLGAACGGAGAYGWYRNGV